MGGIEGLTDAEAERVARVGVAIGPVATGAVEADGVDVEEAIERRGAHVVAEHQPAVDVEIETHRALHVAIDQRQGRIEGTAQRRAHAAEQSRDIAAVDGEALVELGPLGKGELVDVEGRIAAGGRRRLHQQLGAAAGGERQLDPHEAEVRISLAGAARLVLRQQPQAETGSIRRPQQQLTAGAVAAIGIAEAGDRGVEIGVGEGAGAEQLAQRRESAGLGQRTVGRIALGSAGLTGDEGLVPLEQGPLQQGVQTAVGAAGGGCAQGVDQRRELAGEAGGNPLVVGGGGDEHPPLGRRQLGEGQQGLPQLVAILDAKAVAAAGEVAEAHRLQLSSAAAAPQQHALGTGTQLDLGRLTATGWNLRETEALAGPERLPAAAAIAAQLQIAAGRQIGDQPRLTAAQTASRQLQHQGGGGAGLETHLGGQHQPLAHQHREAAGIEGAAAGVQARHAQLEALRANRRGGAVEERRQGIAGGIAQGGGIEAVHHQGGAGRQTGGEGHPQGAVGADGAVSGVEISAAQQARWRHHRGGVVAAARIGGRARQQVEPQAEAGIGEQPIHQPHEVLGGEHLAAEALQLAGHGAQSAAEAGGGVARLARQPGGQRRQGVDPGGEGVDQSDEAIDERQPFGRALTRCADAEQLLAEPLQFIADGLAEALEDRRQIALTGQLQIEGHIALQLQPVTDLSQGQDPGPETRIVGVADQIEIGGPVEAHQIGQVDAAQPAGQRLPRRQADRGAETGQQLRLIRVETIKLGQQRRPVDGRAERRWGEGGRSGRQAVGVEQQGVIGSGGAEIDADAQAAVQLGREAGGQIRQIGRRDAQGGTDQRLDRQIEGDAGAQSAEIEIEPVGGSGCRPLERLDRGKLAVNVDPIRAGQTQGGVDGAIDQLLEPLHELVGQYRPQIHQAALQIAQGLAEGGGVALALVLAEQRRQHGRIEQTALELIGHRIGQHHDPLQ